MSQPIRVFIADDHKLAREGTKKLLEGVRGITVIGEAESGEQLVAMARQVRPDVVLMDVRMPGIGGLEATKRLYRLDSDIRVIALTACEDDHTPSRLLQAGAAGYLTKDCSFDEMIFAIRKVAVGQRYISPKIAQQLALLVIEEKHDTPFEVLSEREFQIMTMIVRGCEVQYIAESLNLSPKTVNSHRYRIFQKLGVQNDVELTHLALRHGLLDDILYAPGEEKSQES